MEPIGFEQLTSADWDELIDGESDPWKAPEELEWSSKERHVGIRTAEGRLIAAAGAVVAPVEVGGQAFDVVGIGGVFVTRSFRGQGLGDRVVGAVAELARDLGPDRAMLFCREALVPFYARHGFTEIDAPVRAEQPGGPVRMPMEAMWLGLRDGAGWPAGAVRVDDLPF